MGTVWATTEKCKAKGVAVLKQSKSLCNVESQTLLTKIRPLGFGIEYLPDLSIITFEALLWVPTI